MRITLLRGGLFFLLSLICVSQAAKNSNQTQLQDAAQAIQAGDLPRAEKDLKAALRDEPKDYRALDLLGVVRALQQRKPEAEELFRGAVKAKSDFAPAHAHLGLLYAQTDRDTEALPHLREALRLDPGRNDAADALVRILQTQASVAATADPGKALTLLIEGRKYAPNNPDVQFSFGTIALQMSLWSDAVDAFQQTLRLRNNDPVAIYDLGRAFMGLARFEDARRQFAHYVELRPDDAAGHCALGMTLAALERIPEAREQFERSITLDPAQTESCYRLGLIELNAKNFDKAAQNLRQVLARDPKHAGALSALGRIYFEQKRYPEAIDPLQRAIAVNPSLREAHYYLGLAFARVGRKQEADDELQIATRLEHKEVEQRRTVTRIQDGSADGPLVAPPKE